MFFKEVEEGWYLGLLRRFRRSFVNRDKIGGICVKEGFLDIMLGKEEL